MQIKGSVAFVTGANRGLGKAFVNALLEAGSAKVYAAARNPDSVVVAPNVVPIKLDVTNANDIARRVLGGVEANQSEVLADSVTEHIKQNLSNSIYLSPVSA